jgi:hypothetical protein
MSTSAELATVAACRRQQGQAAVEAALITLVVIAGFWGIGWLQGEGGVLALLIDGLHRWHHRFASLLALPL